MAIQSNFRGNFIAGGTKAARPGFSGTPGLSELSDFATRPDGAPRWATPLKKLAIAAALIAWASPAPADTLIESSNCKFSGYYGYRNCRTTWTRIPAPVRNPEQERLDALASQKEDAKWTAFCKPSFKADEHGVRRASYATPGCEFGRSE